MNNINLKIIGSANLAAVQGPFSQLQTQVQALNTQLASTIKLVNGVDAQGYAQMVQAGKQASTAFRNAAASSGMFEVQQMRVNSATDEYIKKLNKQKLSLKEIAKQSKVSQAAYREQLAMMEGMSVLSRSGATSSGRSLLDVAIPAEASKSLDTAGRRLAFLSAELKSASTQMVNWGKNTQWAGRQLAMGFTFPLAAAGAAAGVLAYQIDKELTRIAKVYDTTADSTSTALEDVMAVEKELGDLRAAGSATALKAAKEYGMAATDTLAVQAELAATGLKGQELQKATIETMRIARLGELDYQTATQSTIALQTIFRMNTDELTKSFNYMNSIENATSLSTQDFATAIPIAAGTVKEFGGDVKELGVLLTAMKSRGIEASQGANALKATMQRLGRPSKQVQEEFKAITNTDLKELVDSSGSLTEIFTKIRDVTKDLAPAQRRDVFAGVFGSYQVKQMMAMVDGMEDIEKGYGQVARAQEIATQSSTQWADTAEREVERYRESISGKWETSFNTFKAQLAEFGEPFVIIATQVINAVTKIMEIFSNLPGPVKIAIAAVLGIAAVAGPLLMLVGLTANLMGNAIKLGANIVGLATKMEILDKETWAARMATEALNTSFMSQTTAAQKLSAELKVLAASIEAARVAQMGGVAAVPGAAAAAAGANQGAVQQRLNTLAQQHQSIQGMIATTQANILNIQQRQQQLWMSGAPAAQLQIARDELLIEQQTLAVLQQQNVTAKAGAGTAAAQAAATASGASAAAAGAQAQSKWSDMTKIGAASAAVATGSMITMMTTSNETAQHWANMALTASIVAPMIGGAAQGAQNLAQRLAQGAANSGGMLAALAGSSLKMGVIGAAVAAVGVGAYFVWKHFHDQKVEAEKLNAELAKATGEMGKQSDLLDQQLDIKQKSNVAEPQAGLQTKEIQKQLPLLLRVADLAEKMNDDAHFKGQAKLIKETNSEIVKRTAATHVYRNVLEATNGSAQKAEEAVAALYTAAGEDASTAVANAKELRQQLEGIANLGNEINRLDMLSAITESGRGNGSVEDWVSSTETFFPWSKADPDKYVFEASAKQGRAFSDNFWNSLMSADRAKRPEITKEFTDNTTDMWATAFKAAQKNEDVSESMEQLGVQNAEQYRVALQAAMDVKSGKRSTEDVRRTLRAAGLATDLDANEIRDALLLADTDYNRGILDADIGVAALDTQKAMTEELRKSLGYEDKSLTLNELLKSARMQLATVTKDTAQSTYDALVAEQKLANQEEVRERLKAEGVKSTSAEYKKQVAEAGKLSIEQRKNLQNQVLLALGLGEAEGVYFDINQAAAEAGDETKDVANELKNLPTNINININADQLSGIVKDGMAGVQQEMADDMTEAMNTRHEAAANALQAAQDAANDALQDSQDRATNALEDSQERATNAMERRHKREEDAHKRHWEKMKDQAEKYWDARIKKAEDELEAEKKAEEQREKMFEAEIARIQKLNDMANTNIDFNMALSEGRFDEAAKLQNNAESDYIAGLYSSQSDQMAAASERRQDALSNRIDILQDRKDAYMQRLDKQEEAQKAALQRRQERESNALKKEQEMQSNALKRRQEMENRALKKRQEADSAALRKSQDMEKKSLQRRLDLFLAFTASNEKELKKHMKDVGISYNDFEKTVIVPKGQKWGSYFGSRLKYHMRQSALQLRSDAVWEALGKGAADGILDSIGFDNMAQFNHFVKTGEMKEFKSPKITGQKAASNKGNPNRPSGSGREMNETRHQGGLIGSGKGSSRKGVAPTMKGLHHTERMVLAQKGEYMVNAKSAAANMDLLEGINSGNGVMGGLGITGLVSGLMSRMMIAGLSRGMQKGTDKVKQKYAASAMAGMIGSAAAGTYGDASFSAEQMKNAQIIASVGKSMGMSARDIQIGIMTAITESMLRNVNYGDRDSLGLFQQRPSMGWGTPAQVTDPKYASRKFFEGLKGVGNRGRMDPWAAAQAVQRSAFADGSNYRKWWNESTAIWKALSAGSGAGFVMGPGGRFKPINRAVTSGLHDTGTPFPGLDFSAPVGTPLYAVGDGVISKSYDIRGYEPRRAAYGKGQDGYRSYGRVVYLRTDAGPEVLYAHLSSRSVHAGQRVRGGSIIGRSGDTGNSTGPHLHFGSRGASPYSWLSGRSGGGSMGGFGLANLSGSNIPSLAKGGEIKWDNTIANLHKDERVLTADLNKKFEQGVNNFANGGGNTYNVNVIHQNPTASPDEIAQKTVNRIKRLESRLPGGRNDG